MHIASNAQPFKSATIIDNETGEVVHDETDLLSFQLSKVAKSNKRGRRRVIRRYRYKVQRMVRDTLKGLETPKGNRWRVCDCNRLPIPKARDVIVSQSPSTKSAAMRNLVTCGQVWTCPVCASKVAGVRRDEVRQALERHLGGGLLAVSVTLTVPHGVGHSAKQLLSSMGGALRRMRANRRVLDLRKSYGYVGQIRALEVTWGEANGWHPHFHEIWFFRTQLWSESTADAMQKVISGAWQSAVVTGGLASPSDKHGVLIKRIETPRDYEGKGNASIDGVDGWDAADELTRAVAKTGRADRLSPFDLLVYGYQDRFREYAKAFHGKRQLTWSPGLKAHFAIGERTDEEIAEEEEDRDGVPVLAIEHGEWVRAIKLHPELSSIVLDEVELRGSIAAVEALKRIGITSRSLEPPPE
jgi:hypothetical protein